MLGNKAAPIVRVVFACKGCSAPFEATQIHRPAEGSFACGFVATRCIYGQVVTTMRNGDLYEGRGTEEHGRGRCQRKVLTTIPDRDPPDRRIEFPQRCQLRCKLYRT